MVKLSTANTWAALSFWLQSWSFNYCVTKKGPVYNYVFRLKEQQCKWPAEGRGSEKFVLQGPKYLYTHLFLLFLSVVSVTKTQPQSDNTEWTFSEVNVHTFSVPCYCEQHEEISCSLTAPFLGCEPFLSTLSTLPTCWSSSSCLLYQVTFWGI